MIREFCVLSFLTYFSYQDIKFMKISKTGILFFAILGIGITILKPIYEVKEIVLGMGLGVLLLAGSWISRENIGKGDGILVLICGIYLGIRENFFLLFCALLLSSILAFLLWVSKKASKKQKIPFIPFLFMAYIGRILLYYFI